MECKYRILFDSGLTKDVKANGIDKLYDKDAWGFRLNDRIVFVAIASKIICIAIEPIKPVKSVEKDFGGGFDGN